MDRELARSESEQAGWNWRRPMPSWSVARPTLRIDRGRAGVPVLVFWRHPTPFRIVGLALVTLVVLGIIEFFGRGSADRHRAGFEPLDRHGDQHGKQQPEQDGLRPRSTSARSSRSWTLRYPNRSTAVSRRLGGVRDHAVLVVPRLVDSGRAQNSSPAAAICRTFPIRYRRAGLKASRLAPHGGTR